MLNSEEIYLEWQLCVIGDQWAETIQHLLARQVVPQQHLLLSGNLLVVVQLHLQLPLPALHLLIMNRGPGKKMLQSSSKLELLAKMVRKACHPTTPSLEKSLARNRENLDLTFQEFYHDFKLYKADVNDPGFNDKDEDGNDKHENNDSCAGRIL